MSPLDHAARLRLAPLRARLGDAALFFDLDGTIAAIRPRPEEVSLSPQMRAGVAALVHTAGFVGFVSGRSLVDLEAIVSLPGCAYAGNHGMEIRLPGGDSEVVPEVRPHLDALRAFAQSVDTERLAAAGAWLEDKGITLSVHYRTAPDQGVARAAIDAQIVPRAEAAGLRVTSGRKVVEVRPAVSVHKGTAVRHLATTSGCRLGAYLGDDVTDVEAWIALRELEAEGTIDYAASIAVVGHETSDSVREQADVELTGVDGALDLVRWLGEGPGEMAEKGHRGQG
jgi:trehalose 6-phosphate phosphatase